MSEDLRYPIGDFDADYLVTKDLRDSYIRTIKNLRIDLAQAVEGLSEEQLETEYRPGGWTVRQVVHHIADSHVNAFCRFKLALTEDFPTIRPYAEAEWAKLADYKMPIKVSLDLIENIHARWAVMLESLTDEDFLRQLDHPDSGVWTLEKMLGLYDWHSRHHTAHITSLRSRMGW